MFKSASMPLPVSREGVARAVPLISGMETVMLWFCASSWSLAPAISLCLEQELLAGFSCLQWSNWCVTGVLRPAALLLGVRVSKLLGSAGKSLMNFCQVKLLPFCARTLLGSPFTCCSEESNTRWTRAPLTG